MCRDNISVLYVYTVKPLGLAGRCPRCARTSTRRYDIAVLTPPSAIRGLPHLLHQGEVLSFRDYHKWILRPILGLGRDRYVVAVDHTCWLVTTPGVLISGHIRVGVIFSGRKRGYL